MKTNLKPVIGIDEDKCVNCHMCIAVCPVKYCIDGSGDKVRINHDSCIGCASCVTACTHDARTGLDDLAAFLQAARNHSPMVAIVAPAVAAHFPKDLLRLNGWLASLGVKAVFDVSFGAELTVDSYLEHIQKNNPRLVIAQPCPVIVSYLEIHQPELLPYLAPADSPMMHTMKLIREWHPEYHNCKIAVISPCVAKRREFDAVGIGDFNVTIEKLIAHMKEQKVDLSRFPELNFANPPAERAVLFSSPGGLKATIEREVPTIGRAVRKIEGKVVYDYFRELPEALARKVNPLIIDCLNCEKGCNGGTGTGAAHLSVEVLEAIIDARKQEQQKRLAGQGFFKRSPAKAIKKLLKKYRKPGLYVRRYSDQSRSLVLNKPDNKKLDELYRSMRKEKKEDHLNCASCGYNNCEAMAIAIHNGLNHPKNCHHFQANIIRQTKMELEESTIRLNQEIVDASQLLESLLASLPDLDARTQGESQALMESSASVEELVASLKSTSRVAETRRSVLEDLASGARQGEESLARSGKAISDMASRVNEVLSLVKEINKIAAQTNLLSMNAAIEAAHAGDAGRGFAVVAAEIRSLSEQAAKSASQIGRTLQNLATGIRDVDRLSIDTGTTIRGVLTGMEDTTNGLLEIFQGLLEMSGGTDQLMSAIKHLTSLVHETQSSYHDLGGKLRTIGAEIQAIASISEQSARNIQHT